MTPVNRSLILLFVAVPVAIALVALVFISVIISSSHKYLYDDTASVPHTQAALILGAGVLKSGDLSPVLQDRVDQAIDLYRAGKVEGIIASGNRSSDYDEVDPIVTYLTNHDIPVSAIQTDYAGFDTYSSMYRARDVFGLQSVSIVSQSFHLPRAVYIARKLGLTAYGVSADRGHYKLGNYFREMFADVKAMLNVAGHRQPAATQADTTQDLFTTVW